MKFCYHCGRITAGEPLFCNFCGRSYDRKLCPRLHVNPRHAEVCSQCGSRDFSTPQPKVSLGLKFLAGFMRVFLGAVLGVITVIFCIGGLMELLKQPAIQSVLIAIGLVLLVLWLLWSLTPTWFRKLIHKSIKRKERRHAE